VIVPASIAPNRIFSAASASPPSCSAGKIAKSTLPPVRVLTVSENFTNAVWSG